MKKLWIIGGGSALLVLGIILGAFLAGPIIATASSQKAAAPAAGTAGTAESYCNQYLNDVASRLNVGVDKLKQAGVGAADDLLAQLVKDGKLSQDQANKIKQRIGSGDVCSNLKNMGSKQGAGPGHFNMQNLQKYLGVAVANVAKNLNLTSDQLKAQVQSGKTLSQIAQAKGVSETKLQTIVTNAVQDALKQAVAAGDLTQAQADMITKQLTSNPQMLERILTQPFGQGAGNWQQPPATTQQ